MLFTCYTVTEYASVLCSGVYIMEIIVAVFIMLMLLSDKNE